MNRGMHLPRLARPGYKSLRTGRLLEEGMIITVEPGCYFNPVLLEPAFEVRCGRDHRQSEGFECGCCIPLFLLD